MRTTTVVFRAVHVTADIRCNRCGDSCRNQHENFAGLIEVCVTGGYGELFPPDLERWRFSLCEPCLGWLVSTFQHYPSTREIIPRVAGSADEVEDPETGELRSDDPPCEHVHRALRDRDSGSLEQTWQREIYAASVAAGSRGRPGLGDPTERLRGQIVERLRRELSDAMRLDSSVTADVLAGILRDFSGDGA